MKCTRCKNEIGEIKEVYTNFCKLSSRTKMGFILQNPKGETVAWVSEEGMICNNCRPSATFTHINWTFNNNQKETSK